MPLVFVHGVANRQTPKHQAEIHQRDELFKKLVLPKGAVVFDPDWGSNAVTFQQNLPWLPNFREADAFNFGSSPSISAQSGIGKLAARKPEMAIDLAFEAGLAARAQEAADANKPNEALTKEDLESFTAAVQYLENGADKDVFYAQGSDENFLEALNSELKPYIPKEETKVEAMSFVGDALKWIGKGLKNLVSPVENVAANTVLLAVRRPLTARTALFLGDIFVYLRWRETDRSNGTVNRIFEPIITDLVSAAKLRTKNDPLIVVAHSLGGVITYDLFSDPAAVANIEAKSGSKLIIDAWITVGAQPGLFADMGLYGPQPGNTEDTYLPRPAPVAAWLNIYDYTDILSFSCAKVFKDVDDFEFDNVSGLFDAHSAYFQRPGFYRKMRERLDQVRKSS